MFQHSNKAFDHVEGVEDHPLVSLSRGLSAISRYDS